MTNIWSRFRKWTTARIGLGRVGYSLKTKEWLSFLRSHAEARYAVHTEMDWSILVEPLQKIGLPLITLDSAIQNRQQYLLRPDYGRKLCTFSREHLSHRQKQYHDISFVLTEGLSALALQSYGVQLLQQFMKIEKQDTFFKMGPVCLVKNGRVAIGDEIGELLQSQIVVVVIGERPGLSAADSLGIYFTYAPSLGKNDADRNCISNIRKEGLAPEQAALKLNYLLRQSLQRRISGIELKDDVVLNYNSKNKISS